MVSRLKFRPRSSRVEPPRDTETKMERLCGWPCKGVGGTRDLMPTAGGDPGGSFVESTRKKSLVGSGVVSVPETDTGG